MQNIIALIYSSDYSQKAYHGLCDVRPDYMLPFGARYRIIDFSLSNITNYNISRVVLYTDKNLRSTLDHIADGKNWELNRRVGGLSINPPQLDRHGRASEIETYYESLKYFMHAKQEYIYITNPMYITKPDISDAYETMKLNDLDALVFYKKVNDDNGIYINQKILNISDDGKSIHAGINLGSQSEINLFAGSIMIKKDVFIKILKYSIERNMSSSFLEALFKFNNLKVDLYESLQHLELISDLTSFYYANMRLLKKEIFDDMFKKDGLVYTKSKDEPSTTYLDGSNVSNSLIANGAVIEGQVTNSIVFRGVKIKKGAKIRNSILFQECVIEEDTILTNCIIEKKSCVSEGLVLAGSRAYPYVTRKSEIVENTDKDR